MRGSWLSAEEFEDLVYAAWDDVPDFFADKVKNLAVLVEDLPTRDDLDSLNLHSPYQLFGLYRGVPLTRRGIYFGHHLLPDVIVIFRKPILHYCRTVAEVRKQVRKTLAHEIGHYFGLDEEQVRSAMHDYLEE